MRILPVFALVVLGSTLILAQPQPERLQSLRISGPINDVVWDGSRSRFVVAAGTSVLTVDPDRATVDATLAVGEAVGKIAISDDGQFVYAWIESRRVIRRYRTREIAFDLEIPVWRVVTAMAAVPEHPRSLLVAFAYSDGELAVYDDAVPRVVPFTLPADSMYTRAETGLIYAYGDQRLMSIKVEPGSIRMVREAAAPFTAWTKLCWSGRYATDREGRVLDLDAGVMVGSTGKGPGGQLLSEAVVDAAGASVAAIVSGAANAEVRQYSLATFRPMASVTLTPEERGRIGTSLSGMPRGAWGRGGILFAHGEFLNFLKLETLEPLTPPTEIVPTVDASGVIRVPLPGRALAYDERRGEIWVAVNSASADRGNTLVAINARNGRVGQTIETASPVSSVAVSGDGSHLFALQDEVASVATFSLSSHQRTSTIHPAIKTYPTSLAAVAGQADSMAVVWRTPVSAYTTEITVYDNGAARPRSVLTGYSVGRDTQAYLTGIYPGDAADSFTAVDLEHTTGNRQSRAGRLVVEPDGISFDRALPLLGLGAGPGRYGSPLAHDGDLLFTGAGEMWAAQTESLQGTFPLDQSYSSIGIPIPFADDNRIAFVHTSGFSPEIKLAIFEISTQRPLAVTTLPGVAAFIGAGAGTVAISTGSEIRIVPLSSVPPWPEVPPNLQTVAPGVRRMNLRVSSMAGRPHSSELVVALPGLAGAHGNGVAVVNTSSGQLERSVYVGSNPTALFVTRDGSGAYVYLEGEQRVARVDLESGNRDLVFVPDPTGQGRQYPVYDLALGPDEALTASYYGGWLATFDRGVLRPVVDKNTHGPGGYSGAVYRIVINSTGTIVYANDDYWSTNGFKRAGIEADGIRPLSSTAGLMGNKKMTFAGGLIYTAQGRVVDPERSRHVGQFELPGDADSFIVPDTAAGRIYAITGNRLAVYDSRTYNRIAGMWVGDYSQTVGSLVRYGADGLAFHTSAGEIYLIHIPSIPMLAVPLPTAQPTLPVTDGVIVVDLKASDLAYDAARDRLYASIPNSEAANGDQIVALDPATGAVSAQWRTARNPNLLALAGDGSRVFFTYGLELFASPTRFSPEPERISALDLASGEAPEGFPDYPRYADASFSIRDLIALPEHSASVVAIDSIYANSGSSTKWRLHSLRVYDNGTARPKPLLAPSFKCSSLAQGAHWTQLYCWDGSEIVRLAVDEEGVSAGSVIRLLPGRGTLGRMAYHQGRIYTTTGNVVDVEAGRVVRRVNAYGPVAVQDGRVYWLEPGNGPTTVILRAFDAATLEVAGEKTVNVTGPAAGRLVACGNGRLAFQTDQEIYIVTP